MDKFTNEQKNCIKFFPKANNLKKHLLIEAGAGAGKTAVITERIKWLLNNKKLNINPSQLFIVTFSNDAANQLQEKIKNETEINRNLSDKILLLHISTIDSFFAELVNCIYPSWWESKQKNSYLMPPHLQLIDDEVVIQGLKYSIHRYLNENNFNESTLSLVIDFILSGAIKTGYLNNDGTLENILKILCNENFLAASSTDLRIATNEIHPATELLIQDFHKIARTEYENRILKGEFTYSYRTLFLKENLKKNIPIHIQELIVDEYQDTNQIQHEILFNMVMECEGRMIVVGDPKQSIYGFRNASVDVFQNLKFNESWSHIELNKNFRSEPTLLSEINKLSSLTFQWENPNYPKEFYNSFFFKEAKKKFTPENALIPGKVEFNKNENYCVSIITTSLNKHRFHSNELNQFILENKIKLEDYSLKVFSSFIKLYQSSKKIRWNDIIVLCEENKDVIKFSNELQNQGIPVFRISKTEQENSASLENRVALSLVKCLLEEEDLFDVYQIMQSPISIMTHTEIEIYFSNIKKNKSTKNLIIELINEYKIIAKDNFFKSWQLLRWQIVELHQSESSKLRASLFCARMDQFASSLAAKLQSPSIRNDLELKVANILDKDKNISMAFNNSILPDSIEQWNINSTENEICEANNFLEVKTVHKAKGLQWKHVFFYPKHGGNKPLSRFITSTSGKFFDITWLQEDSESMSVVNRIKNHKFSEVDNLIEYKKNGEIQKIFRFPNLRKQAEHDFERQRVFYTAFTRAETNLILLQPKRLKKDGLFDELTKIKNENENTLPFQKYLEEETYLKYLNFNFRSNVVMNKKNKEFNEIEILNEEFPKTIFDKNNIIFYRDYGPKFVLNLYKDEKHLNINHNSKNQDTNEYYFLDEKNQENKNILDENNHNNKTKNRYFNISEQIYQKKQNREFLSKGILYHAAAENRKAFLGSLQHKIESKSVHVYHEFEIWINNENKNNFVNTSRHIIDFLAIISIKNFLELPLYKIFDLQKNEENTVNNMLSKYSENTKILLVLDYKTGRKELSHINQIENYMHLVSSLKIINYVEFDNSSIHEYIIIGAIYYIKNSEINNFFSMERKSFPSNIIENNEQIFLFTKSNA